jgi:hypothetical protein
MKLPLLFLLVLTAGGQTVSRPPAVPLVVHDPYFSIWAMSDQVTDQATRHWTGAEHPLSGIIRVDGKPNRFLGNWRRAVEPMPQTGLTVTATRTSYSFAGSGVALTMEFVTPAIPNDLELLSRPVTYVVFGVQSTDGRDHDVSLYFDAASQLAINAPGEDVTWARLKMGDLAVLRAGSANQKVLGTAGDDVRINWGYLYLSVPPQAGAQVLATNQTTREMFATSGTWPDNDDAEAPAQSSRNQIVLAARFDLGKVGAAGTSRHLMLAYDDLFSIQYFYRNLRPWWRRAGAGPAELLTASAREWPAVSQRCRQFDADLRARLERDGGRLYADIAILAYRQTLAAHKLVADFDGSPLYLSKENFSNGCIGTVDVTYPSAPFFLVFNPELLKAQVRPILDYAALARWPWPYAPHDLGTYPLANGQVYGGGEKSEDRQMPVEESGNMLILAAAIAKAEGNAEFSRKYWPLLTKWAEYLRSKGLDPENQLSTDDFAGHLAHNTNLSIKAILALGAYSRLAGQLGFKEAQSGYHSLARKMAADWEKMAAEGDHYRLAFDKPGTWSQKYNLVWDRLLGLNLFSPAVVRTEVAFYVKSQNRYGLPLDSRKEYTKLDWILWTASLAARESDFEALVAPVHRFLNESPARVPMTDWYWTTDGKQAGFQARSVVGGVLVKSLMRQWAPK